ncbi:MULTISPECIES: DUF3847 domain-containing protein [Lachnospiraceae]|uniref:DUF3847 domain-containing protein n=1 Tax=Lachnospiraceae TaxID=186803 RepID=UPI001D4F302E|nr:DUF3847 domain-containing protein [Hungatella hathewayi]MBS6755733.1 DUF3847 domain-containing protein [Hungatella hathewayi]
MHISNEERRARTHRLIDRGAIPENLLDRASKLTGKQVRAVLNSVLHSAAARETCTKFARKRVRRTLPCETRAQYQGWQYSVLSNISPF